MAYFQSGQHYKGVYQVGEDMPEHYAEVGGPRHSGPIYEVLMLDRQGLSAHNSGVAGPQEHRYNDNHRHETGLPSRYQDQG